MFRQKRKQRYEVNSHVEELIDGMTARDLTEHLRFWKLVNTWGEPVKKSKEFFSIVEKKIEILSKNETKKKQEKNLDDAKSLVKSLDRLDGTVFKEIVQVGVANSQFKKALTTEKTDHGVKVGHYLIKIKPFRKRYLYDVINLETNEVVSKDIKLYEMSFCLVNYLNDELLYTDPKMIELHEIYNQYVQYSNTASHYKKMYFDAKKRDEQSKEAKNQLEFEKNRDLALECKAKITDLFKKNTE